VKPPFAPNDKLYLSETISGGIEDTPEERRISNIDANNFFEDFTYPKESWFHSTDKL